MSTRLVRRDAGAMGPDRRAGQLGRPRAARAAAGDHRRGSGIRGWRSISCRPCGRPGGDAGDGGAEGGGAIINISTFATFEPDPVFPTSGVFRAGLAAFTKLFADRYAAENIRMNNILPGFIDSLPEKEEFRAPIPMGRYGKVAEIAGVISFLASDAAGLHHRAEPAGGWRASPGRSEGPGAGQGGCRTVRHFSRPLIELDIATSVNGIVAVRRTPDTPRSGDIRHSV